MSLGQDVSGSVMGSMGHMGSNALNTAFRIIDLIKWISEQREKNFSLCSGETDMASLQKFVDKSRDGKGTVSLPRTQLEAFRWQAASHGVSYAVSEAGNTNTVDIIFAKGRDSETINQILKNMAQMELNAVDSKWIIDRDTDGIKPEVADLVYRKNDIEQFSFSGIGGSFTIYNREMAEAYMLAKNEAREQSLSEQIVDPLEILHIQENSLQNLSRITYFSDNPQVRDLQCFANDNQMFVINSKNDKLMWINFNENASRSEIQNAITDKLGITDRAAVAELMNGLDNDQTINFRIPAPAKFEIDNRFNVSAVTDTHVAIVDTLTRFEDPLIIPKSETSPERLAKLLNHDLKEDKSLLETLSKACNPPDMSNAKAFRSFQNHILTAQKAIDRERKKLAQKAAKEARKADRAFERGGWRE
jgi:hypothetical protein